MSTSQVVNGSVLQALEVSVSYGRAQALSNASLNVQKGQIVGVTAASGVGKSSFLRAITGYLPHENARVQSLKIAFRGEDISSEAPDRRARRGLGFVPERSKIVPVLSVEDNILLGVRGKLRGDALDRAFDIFPELAAHRRKQAVFLSGGERQMAAVSAAMAHSPDVLIIDEASLGLAPVRVATLLEGLRSLAARGTTMVIAEQNPAVLKEIADSVCVLRIGGGSTQGPATELLGSDRARQLAMGLGGEAP